jgi:uncharacterized protein YceK
VRSLLLLLAVALLLSGCATGKAPEATGEPPSTAVFQYPYNPRW